MQSLEENADLLLSLALSRVKQNTFHSLVRLSWWTFAGSRRIFMAEEEDTWRNSRGDKNGVGWNWPTCRVFFSIDKERVVWWPWQLLSPQPFGPLQCVYDGKWKLISRACIEHKPCRPSAICRIFQRYVTGYQRNKKRSKYCSKPREVQVI